MMHVAYCGRVEMRERALEAKNVLAPSLTGSIFFDPHTLLFLHCATLTATNQALLSVPFFATILSRQMPKSASAIVQRVYELKIGRSSSLPLTHSSVKFGAY
jgi:hypothetical protein